MVILTPEQIVRLQTRLNNPIFAPAKDALVTSANQILVPQIKVPPAGIAGWNHDYFCPAHNAPLVFDVERPHQHICSYNGETLTGTIYDASWWRKINLILAEGAQARAVLYVAGESAYFESVRDVLLAYAAVYPSYAVHGAIPFNGPGKANCQTLDEAGWIIPLATAYDLIRDDLSSADRAQIAECLLRECAAFLLEHQEQQLHNHQCWIAAAIGVIGLVIESPEWVDMALNDRWGMIDQLERGVLTDGLWCELTPTYHYYAFEALSRFARFAGEAARQVREHPAFIKMPLAGLRLLLPDNTFPLLNDTTPPLGIRDAGVGGYGLAQIAPRLEIAAGWWDDPAYGWALAENYQTQPRASLEALLYGRDSWVKETEPARPSFLREDYHAEAGGILLVRHPRAGIGYVMVKNGPDGGEHDHRDRPGLYIGLPNGERFAPDLGTIPYGLPLHYGWFKTTQGHNTVMIDSENQPAPSATRNRLHTDTTGTLIRALVAWGAIESAYCGVVFNRRVIVTETGITDLFMIRAPQPVQADWLFHFKICPAFDPLTQFERTDDVHDGGFEAVYRIPRGTTELKWSDRLHIALPGGVQHYLALAPDNPFESRESLWVLIARVNARRHTFVHQWDFDPQV
jgi:hypothetical protein